MELFSVMHQIEALEREKYRKIWERPEYRQWSPGAAAVDNFLKGVDWMLGQSVVDLGCGTGRAGAALAERGLDVTLLDFMHSAVEFPDMKFIEACLWDIPETQWFDWAFCVDVMEHIPTSMVTQTLGNIHNIIRRGGYFQIALFEDGCGRMIGETLHMTVKSADWWYKELEAWWAVMEDPNDRDARGNSGYAKFIVRSR